MKAYFIFSISDSILSAEYFLCLALRIGPVIFLNRVIISSSTLLRSSSSSSSLSMSWLPTMCLGLVTLLRLGTITFSSLLVMA